MISSSRRYLGGLKKCVPSQCLRKSSLRPSAIAAIEIPDVFDVTMVPGRRTASTRSSSARFTSSCSTTASVIQSTAASFDRSPSKPPVATSAAASAVKNGSGFSARARFSPSRAMSAVRSSSTTGTPAFATCAAICAPIVPAPSTAIARVIIVAGRR